MDEDSKQLLTISAHKELVRYNRFIFGIAAAPAIFQRRIKHILIDIPGVKVILDDMIIIGDTDESHFQNLEKVLQKFNEYNIRVNPDAYEFFKDNIKFCGFKGLHKTEENLNLS